MGVVFTHNRNPIDSPFYILDDVVQQDESMLRTYALLIKTMVRQSKLENNWHMKWMAYLEQFYLVIKNKRYLYKMVVYFLNHPKFSTSIVLDKFLFTWTIN